MACLGLITATTFSLIGNKICHPYLRAFVKHIKQAVEIVIELVYLVLGQLLPDFVYLAVSSTAAS